MLRSCPHCGRTAIYHDEYASPQSTDLSIKLCPRRVLKVDKTSNIVAAFYSNRRAAHGRPRRTKNEDRVNRRSENTHDLETERRRPRDAADLEAGVPRSETRSGRPETIAATVDRKLEAGDRNRKPSARGQGLAPGHQRLETRGGRSETGDRRQETANTRGKRPKTMSAETTDRGPKNGDRSPETGVWWPEAGASRPETRPETRERRQETGGRRPRKQEVWIIDFCYEGSIIIPRWRRSIVFAVIKTRLLFVQRRVCPSVGPMYINCVGLILFPAVCEPFGS